MIRINLLPVGDEKFIQSAKLFLIFSAIVVAFLLVVVFANNSVLAKREELNKSRLEEADKEIANLKTIIGKINELKEKKKKLQEKITMIIKLQEENIGPVRVLDEVSLKLPSNKVWIDSIGLSGTRMQIEGKSLDNQEVASFMKQLESSMFFNRIELQRIQKESSTMSDLTILKFSMVGEVVLAGKKSSEAEAKPAATQQPQQAQQPAAPVKN